MLKKVKGQVVSVAKRAAAGTALVAGVVGSASAQTGVDTTEILAAIADSETKGIAIAIAVTVMLFLFASVKYLRRAK